MPEEKLQIGVSRPALAVDDLPTPEEVFKLPKIGAKEMITAVLGPSMIALGVSIGSGEWLLGPLGFGKFGFMGLGFLVTISAILQTFYNVENARYTLATGEVPVVGFTRTPPGLAFWVPVTLLLIYLAWIWGGWAAAAGQSLYALVVGRTFDAKNPAELQTVRYIAIALLFLSLGIYLFGKKISRTLEFVESAAVFIILFVLITLSIVFAPASLWGTMLASIVTPAALPKGIDATTLGSIIGYTGFASGMNFMLINYYRDHGYGMGSKIGFFSGIIGGQKQEVLPSGVTFRETEQNAKTWKRWFRFLVVDQWLVFFVGAMIGMFIPSVLAVSLAVTPGAAAPTSANMPVF
ncbi:MAG: Nramp family divalent metal transporter, partial [Chloroflexota bacterium]